MTNRIVLVSVTVCVFLLRLVTVAQEKHDHSIGKPEKLGTVHFPISGNSEAQAKFDRAVALLHSFWYQAAQKAFNDVAATDPGCAMAYWGVAMSLYHPLWEPPDVASLKAGLEAVEKAKAVGAKTEREKDYVAAIEVFYKNADKLDHRTRALAYEKAMEQLSQKYPDDREASIFYALALNGTALPTDKTYANQKKAGAILEKVLTEQPDHPGVAHYIIHSYDYPPLASQALSAARRYAKIAPSSPHALHMPSHIFTRLGLWQESIESNIASAAAGKENNLPGDQLHAMDYLMYAYLQGAQDREAKLLLDELKSIQKYDVNRLTAPYAIVAMSARYAVERGHWDEAARLEVDQGAYRYVQAMTHFARAVGAARSGDTLSARKNVEKLEGIYNNMISAKNSYWASQVEIQRRAGAAWLARAQGKNDEALKLMRSAADLESSTEKHPVTPGPILPARELLGDLLLELGQPKEALGEYEASLAASPNRFRGLYGAAKGAEFSGDQQKAKNYYAKVVEVCSKADSDRPELAEAKTILARK